MWVRVLVLQNLGILLDGGSTIEHRGLDIRHVFAESCILVLDLVRELTSVTHDEDGRFAIDRLDLLETGKDEDGGLTETGFGLAENIGSENCLRDTNLLNCRVNRADVRSSVSPSL